MRGGSQRRLYSARSLGSCPQGQSRSRPVEPRGSWLRLNSVAYGQPAETVADPGRPHSRFAGPKQEPSTRWGVLLLVVRSESLRGAARDGPIRLSAGAVSR